MSDTTGADAGAAPEGAPAGAPAAPSTGPETPKTFTQDQVNALLANQKRDITGKYVDYDQFKADAAELAKIREGEKTELQKANERAADAEKRAAKAEFNSLRNKVATAKGVPASSLTGSTEDELNASADELIAWRDANAPKPPEKPAPKRNPAGAGGGLKSGATGSDGGSDDPKEKAAEALRRLRGTS